MEQLLPAVVIEAVENTVAQRFDWLAYGLSQALDSHFLPRKGWKTLILLIY